MVSNTKTANVPKTVTVLVSTLPPRQKDVIVRRFGLKDGKRRTLDEIGKQYEITRERVRQIENDAKSAILKSEHLRKLESFLKDLVGHFEAHGGMRAEHALFSNDVSKFFPSSLESDIAKAYLHFLLSIHDVFEKHSETEGTHAVWALKHTDPVEVKRAVEGLVNRLRTHKELVEKEKLLEWLGELTGESDEKALESYLAISKLIDANVYGEYGLTHWPEVNTRGVRDKAYVVLKKYVKPMHFREIVDHINRTFPLKKEAHPQTVHNELIKSDKFVLVGRGTYALTDWGYRPGSVFDVLVRILKEAGKPLSKDEIIKAVLEERNVKLNTVLLNLQNRAYFEKMNDGRFALRI